MIEQKKSQRPAGLGALGVGADLFVPKAGEGASYGEKKLEKLKIGIAIDEAVRALKDAASGSTFPELPPATPIGRK